MIKVFHEGMRPLCCFGCHSITLNDLLISSRGQLVLSHNGGERSLARLYISLLVLCLVMLVIMVHLVIKRVIVFQTHFVLMLGQQPFPYAASWLRHERIVL